MQTVDRRSYQSGRENQARILERRVFHGFGIYVFHTLPHDNLSPSFIQRSQINLSHQDKIASVL